MSYEEEDTCVPHEEEDTCVPYEENVCRMSPQRHHILARAWNQGKNKHYYRRTNITMKCRAI